MRRSWPGQAVCSMSQCVLGSFLPAPAEPPQAGCSTALSAAAAVQAPLALPTASNRLTQFSQHAGVVGL